MTDFKNITKDSSSRTSEKLISVPRNATTEVTHHSAENEEEALWNRSLKFYEDMKEASN